MELASPPGLREIILDTEASYSAKQMISQMLVVGISSDVAKKLAK